MIKGKYREMEEAGRRVCYRVAKDNLKMSLVTNIVSFVVENGRIVKF